MNIIFLHFPFLFLLIPVIILLVFFYFVGFKKINFSGLKDIKKIYKKNSFLYKLKYLFLLIFLFSFILALSKPTINYNIKENKKLNLSFIIDLSYSMVATDIGIKPRYDVIINGIKEYDNSKIIRFAGGIKEISFPELKLINNKYIKNINLENDGSSIGSALLFSTKNIDLEHKNIFFLFSDGGVNEGKNILETLAYFKGKNIKIFTFGIGGDKETEVFVDNGFGNYIAKKVSLIDEVTLKKIALETSGKYFRVYNSESIEKNINEIIEKNSYNLVEKRIILSNILYIISMISFLIFSFISIRFR